METTAQHDPGHDHGSLGGAVAMSPIVQTLVLMAGVSVLTWTGKHAGNVDPFVLQAPVTEPWWGALVSIYAHSSPGHLASNAVVLVLAGGLVSLSTTWLRFHAFFVGSGVLAGVAHVWVTDLLGTPVGGLGASGATFALVGYVLAANPASDSLFGRASSVVVGLLAVALALAMTVVWSAPGSAYFVHFVGAVLGLLAGRLHLLRA
jgi:membrane associated rhomboid family serine protease